MADPDNGGIPPNPPDDDNGNNGPAPGHGGGGGGGIPPDPDIPIEHVAAFRELKSLLLFTALIEGASSAIEGVTNSQAPLVIIVLLIVITNLLYTDWDPFHWNELTIGSQLHRLLVDAAFFVCAYGLYQGVIAGFGLKERHPIIPQLKRLQLDPCTFHLIKGTICFSGTGVFYSFVRLAINVVLLGAAFMKEIEL